MQMRWHAADLRARIHLDPRILHSEYIQSGLHLRVCEDKSLAFYHGFMREPAYY